MTSDRQNYVSPWEGTEPDDDIVANDDPTFFETVGQPTGTNVTGKQ